MKRLVLILAAFALLPAVAAADDLSAGLSGSCQGIASLVTSGSTISYGIITNHPNPNSATITGGGANVNLQASFNAGSAAGTVSAASGTIANMNASPGNFTLQISGPAGTCTGSLINNGSSGTGTAGTFELGAATYQVLETGVELTVTVNRAGGSTGAASVDYATSDDSATAGDDYEDTSGTLNWADGDGDAQTFTVQIFDNAVEDGNRNFNLTLSNATGGAELGLSAATATIIDDEALVCVADENTLCLGEDGRFKAEITYLDFAMNTGDGETFELGLRDSGLFYFFNQDNIEMLLKVLDFCNADPFNSFAVFYAATTNVGFTLTITDTQTGVVNVYENPLGVEAAPELDITAFDTCP